MSVALIGGSGLTALPDLSVVGQHELETPWGEPSAPVLEGELEAQRVLFLPRHGDPHRIPPHRINYRANLQTLKDLGATTVISIYAVGGISDEMAAGTLAVPHQIIDYTWGRDHTFSDGAAVALQHVDFTEPYSGPVREALLAAARQAQLSCIDHGVYAATQGPRLESAAEIDRLERDGCDLVGMTAMPEAGLARELDLAHGALCLVVNKAAGRSEGIITMAQINGVLSEGMGRVLSVLAAYLRGSPA